MLKFGQDVNANLHNLEKLPDFCVEETMDTKTEKKKQILTDTKRETNETVKAMQEEVKKLENKRKELLAENTNIIDKLHTQKEELIKLAKEKESGKKKMLNMEDDEEEVKMRKERETAKELLDLQSREIDTLMTEINLFRRKGGHI